MTDRLCRCGHEMLMHRFNYGPCTDCDGCGNFDDPTFRRHVARVNHYRIPPGPAPAQRKNVGDWGPDA